MIENDKLIRETQIQNQHGYITIRKDCIITKEEFLECSIYIERFIFFLIHHACSGAHIMLECL